jgi:hypothetical protein
MVVNVHHRILLRAVGEEVEVVGPAHHFRPGELVDAMAGPVAGIDGPGGVLDLDAGPDDRGVDVELALGVLEARRTAASPFRLLSVISGVPDVHAA